MVAPHELEQHRSALTGHCYRMMGSAADADDAVQETMARAWRGRDGFEGRASLRTWLTRIATRVCLDALSDRTQRVRQRARAKLAGFGELPAGAESLTAAQSELLDRYVEAFERYDVAALVRLLQEDATLSMPPYRLWLRGREDITAWMLGRGIKCRGSRLVPTWASGSPAFGQYRTTGPWALIVLELRGDRIAALNYFLDAETLFPRFGLTLARSA